MCIKILLLLKNEDRRKVFKKFSELCKIFRKRKVGELERDFVGEGTQARCKQTETTISVLSLGDWVQYMIYWISYLLGRLGLMGFST